MQAQIAVRIQSASPPLAMVAKTITGDEGAYLARESGEREPVGLPIKRIGS